MLEAIYKIPPGPPLIKGGKKKRGMGRGRGGPTGSEKRNRVIAPWQA